MTVRHSNTGVTFTNAQPPGAFLENDSTVAWDYSISEGRNAVSAGPVTVNSGVTVTVPNNSVWVVV